MFRSAKDQWICTWGEKKSLVDFFCDLRRHQGVAYAILNDWLRDMPDSIDFDKTWDAWYYAFVMIERHLKFGKFYFVRDFLDQLGSKDGSEGFCWNNFWCKFFHIKGWQAGWLSTVKYLVKIGVQSTSIFSFINQRLILGLGPGGLDSYRIPLWKGLLLRGSPRISNHQFSHWLNFWGIIMISSIKNLHLPPWQPCRKSILVATRCYQETNLKNIWRPSQSPNCSPI